MTQTDSSSPLLDLPSSPSGGSGGGYKPTDQTIKETFESIVIAFILAFVFRAYIVEAFVIPTGSMAPTLLGRHVRATCPQCGFDIRSDLSDRATVGYRSMDERRVVNCPMCFEPIALDPSQPTRAGDRILVQKYVYWFSEPRRWDVVVFKAPHDPRTNFIKRLIGLPGERVAILDGNIYIKPDGGDWAIARKTDPDANPHWQKVQRRVWQPIYHTRYQPLDGGADERVRGKRAKWAEPWVAQQGDWRINGRAAYRYEGGDDTDATGAIRFDFDRLNQRLNYSAAGVRYPYDQLANSFNYYSDNISSLRNHRRLNPLWDAIEDVRLAIAIQPDQPGTSVALATTARLAQAPTPIEARLDSQGTLSLQADGQTLGQPVHVTPLQPGRSTRIELWHVDQELLVWVDDRLALRYPIDLSWDQVRQRPAPAPLPTMTVAIHGGPATIHDIQTDRDLYYGVRNDLGRLANGGIERRRDGSLEESPLWLDPDEFFCLGDNSPLSSDGRFWGTTTTGRSEVDPWVDRRMFTDTDDSHAGIVPRRLMIGRAFFVYWPAQLPITPSRPGIVPNFGEMRFIR